MSVIQAIAGQEVSHGSVGRHFRILSTANVGEVDVRITSQGTEYFRGSLSAGLAIDFSDKDVYPQPFDTIYIKSPTSQEVKLWAELAKSDDNRSSAVSTVRVSSSGGSATYHPKQTLNDTVSAYEVLPRNDNRRSATLQISSPCYINDVDGLEVSGSFTWDNTDSISLLPKSAGCEVRILEELN